ncbi:unnamed protein product [Urochloa decumbens]|uniref:F-box domain-containing protein n=1 Tax=Urochloa decumbens TaxID=240449 RepID=A0ABC9BW69_9POAL
MPPTKRARGGGGSKSWLPVRRDPSKLPRRAEGDGTPLPDEILLGIFAGFPEIADLVRCAATCRRWRRLVSGEAAFISRRRPGTGDNKFQPPLALGFFHQHDAAAPRFVPMASAASRRFPGLQSPSPSPLLDSSSCIVASRNGLVVVDLCRGGGGGGKHVRALSGRTAYWWLAKDDVVFALRLDTMEASVLRLQSLFHMDDVSLGFMPEGEKLCAVQLDSSTINTVTYRRLPRVRIITYGRHGGNNEWWKRKEDIWMEPFSLDIDTKLKMRWFCERSGIVFFTADLLQSELTGGQPRWLPGGDWIREVYAFSIRTRTLDKVASKCDESSADPWENFFGYEMDQAAYLSSLADQLEG